MSTAIASTEISTHFPFAAFITNLGKYNEGYLVGEWVQFPTTPEEMQAVFKRIGIGQKDDFGQPYEEWFIADYDCYVPGLYDVLGEYESLDELNYLASRIEELNKYEWETFIAAVEMGEYTGSVKDLINLTENLDCYNLYSDIHNDEDLGYYWIEESGAYDTEAMGNLSSYIDYEAFGRDIRLDEGGTFTDNGYIINNYGSFIEQYSGDREEIPDEYRVFVSGDELNYNQIDGIINNEPPRESEEQNMSDKMKVLVVEPMQEPYTKEIDTGLKSLQKEVDGSIQAIYPFEELAAIICNEEGKINGLELNRALYDDNGKVYDIVAGTFLICGLTGDSFGSLPDELINKFSEQFKHPETFIQVGCDILAIPTEPRKPSIKEQLQQTKNGQGEKPQKPPQKPEPER